MTLVLEVVSERRAGSPTLPACKTTYARSAPAPQRGRTSAIRHLVLQAPAPVIAKALGYHDKTATRFVTEAGGSRNQVLLPRLCPA